MKVKIAIPAALFLQLIFHAGTAQNNALQFKLVEGINGRPLGKINAITQDPHGYMWFAGKTESCIYRYDCTRITAFRHEVANPNSLALGYPETIYADQKGMIWIGGRGLDQYDPATNIFKHYRQSENDSGSVGGFVFVILKDHGGRIWAGTDNGLDLLDEKTGKFLHYRNIPGDPKSLSNNIVRTIYEDHSGVIWVGTGFPWGPDGGGLNRLNPDGTFTRYLHDPNDPHSLINNRISYIFEDSRGILWVGTSGYGLHTMDRSTGRFERLLYDPANPNKLNKPPMKGGSDHIIFINEDNTGAIWIGTYNAGINRYDPDTKKITQYQTSTAPADSTSWTGFISHDGVLWVATENSNLLYRVDPYHKSITRINASSLVTGFLEDNEGYLWVKTKGGGLLKYDQQNNLIRQFKNDPSDSFSLPDNNIGALFQNDENSLWVGTDKGLRIFNKSTQKFTRFRFEGNVRDVPDSGVTCIIQDKRGLIWFSTWGNGLFSYNPSNHSIKHFLNNPKDTFSISSNQVGRIVMDESSNFWAGGSNGINRLDLKTERFKNYLPGTWGVQLLMDARGELWWGNEKGLFRYNSKEDQFSVFLDPQQQINGYDVGAITEDNAKNLWMSSQLGIIKLNTVRNETFIYDKKHGIDPGSIVSWAEVYKNREGRILIPLENGFYTFSPDELNVKTKFQIIITDLLINSHPVLESKESLINTPLEEISDLNLKYNQNNIAFNFAAIDYREPEATRYFTMLENYDNTWREAKGEKSSYYFSVPPGHYVYRVKAFNRDGTKGEKVINILINPPWWQTWWAYTLYVILFAIAVWTFIKWRTKALQKEKIVLEKKVAERTKELKEEKEIVETTLSELKTTQAQLIQSEKMASLGELTAGIAHEIQNPLNFVNNFSEVSNELLDEMKTELCKGNIKEAEEIADNVKTNLEKILHHGKRADAIVKGMLQHSRSNSGLREPTNINSLADEYLRLSYHGLRAKDKSFNATMKTDFDETIGNINIVPQDIGRVILNLITNAFYVVNEKSKQNIVGYEPTVEVNTKKEGNKVLVSVKDNGNGIPQKILDKIFQPFFTTKPTGQGTGLGLSLSYDIVKAHGGELKVETKEARPDDPVGRGEGSEFIIQLPVV